MPQVGTPCSTKARDPDLDGIHREQTVQTKGEQEAKEHHGFLERVQMINDP
jgi:hypothetical protein